MPSQAEFLVVSDLTGGRNALDPPMLLRPTQAAEMSNVEFWQTKFARKRNGMSSSGVTFSAGGPFTGQISTIIRHVPGTDETLAEMWAIDDAATPVVGRKAGATTFTAPTMKDNLTGNGWDVSAASLNGLLFLAYRSAQARLHVWDTSTVRRAGFAVPAAPTVANTGVGSYANTLRYYRVRWIVISGGVVTRRSEPSPSTSFTPSGTGTAARVTQPAVANEGETHWEVEASADNVTFYQLSPSNVAIATTTLDDTTVVATYSTGTVSAATGTYTNQKSYQFIAADQNRLLGFGDWTSANKQNRIEISGVVGSLNISDAERLNTTNTYYLDLDENDSGQPTGLAGPLYGNFYAFKARQLWELRPTGDVTRPYERSAISKTIGAVSGRAWCLGEDEGRRPCLYFMSHRGVYRYGAGGLQYIGRGIEEIVIGLDYTSFTNRINLAASKVVCHMVYHAEKAQLWVWWVSGTGNEINNCAVYHAAYGSWTSYTSANSFIQRARCSCMQSRTFGATFSRDLLPFVGDSGAANSIYMCDDATVTTDVGSSFTSVVNLAYLNPWGPGSRGRVGDCILLANNQAGVTITVRALPDGQNSAGLYSSGTALLTVVGSENYASRRVENSNMTGEAEWVQYRVGEFAATNAAWTIHSLTIPWYREEGRAS